MGSADDGTTRLALVVTGVGLVCIVAWSGYRRSRRRRESAGFFKLLPWISLALMVLGLWVAAIEAGSDPCQDQGAAGLLVRGAGPVGCGPTRSSTELGWQMINVWGAPSTLPATSPVPLAHLIGRT
jgi:hypothetical protein